jgi:hypothetical protein
VNTSNELAAQLRNELRMLRKGTGMSAYKLRQLTVLPAMLWRYSRSPHRDLTVAQLAERIVWLIDQTEDERQVAALHNAYALGPEKSTGGLTARRQAYAGRIGRHADTVELYENRCIEAIIAQLLEAELLPVATAKTPKSSLATGRPAVDTALSRSAAHDMLAVGLDRLYDFGGRSTEVLELFGGVRPVHFAVNVSMDLTSSPKGDEWYIWKLRYSFEARLRRHRIAIVGSAHDGEILLAAGIIDDYYRVNVGGGNQRTETAYTMKHIRIMAHDPAKRIQELMSYRRLGPRERQALLRTVWQLESDECEILEAVLDHELIDGSLHKYVLIVEMEMEMEEPYCFWSAPSTLYLDTLTVDVSRLPRREHWHLIVQPFLGTPIPGSIEANSDKFTLNTGGWVMPGHGVSVVWRPLH